MATAKWCKVWYRAWNVPRCRIFPTMVGTPVVLVDVGANVHWSPETGQFAIMGDNYSRNILHRPNPRVGILSIGEEEHKGNDLTRAAWPMLKSLHINFIGNVEGRDVYAGNVDVIVCDGFTGNVALKVSEGLVDMFKKLLREATRSAEDRVRAFQIGVDLFRVRRGSAAGRAWRVHHRTALPTRMRSRMRSAWRPSSPVAPLNRQIEEELQRLSRAGD